MLSIPNMVVDPHVVVIVVGPLVTVETRADVVMAEDVGVVSLVMVVEYV